MLYKLCRTLARSDIFFYLLLWLMLLLVLGTIAEQQQGLYYAQKTYFSVYFFYLFGIIPLPGTYTILTAIFISLLCKLMLDNWQSRKLGSLITHISGLLLLLGGFITANFSQEGYIDLHEQQTINYISDFHSLELAVSKQDLKSTNKLSEVIFSDNFVNNNTLNNRNLDFSIKVIDYCRHCELINNISDTKAPLLKPLAKPKDSEQNNTIIQIDFIDNQANKRINQNNIYLSVDHQKPYSISHQDAEYKISFRHQRTYLPFNIKLNKFSPEFYPGTEIAKSYQSDVSISNAGNSNIWRSVISMNNPLRYKGYTFYQSSYYLENGKLTSVLAVVYNVGQSFPYIASIVLCIGILVHLLQRLPGLIKPRRAVKN